MSFPFVTPAEIRTWLATNHGRHRALCHCAGVSEFKLSRWLNAGGQLTDAELSRLAGAVGVLVRATGTLAVQVPPRPRNVRREVRGFYRMAGGPLKPLG